MVEKVMSKNEALSKIMREFIFMWILTGLGMILGSFLPPIVALCMSVLALVLLIVTMFIKNRTTVNKIFYAVPFLMGVAFYYSINFYLSNLGTGLVLGILLLTIVLFVTLGFFGMVVIKKDLGFMGQFLLFALIGLILVSIVGFFFASYFLQVALAGFGIILFCLYTLYDFNQMAQRNIQSSDTVGYALNLYLDFINLFLDLLRLVYLLKGDD